jgi:hypothetical protein
VIILQPLGAPVIQKSWLRSSQMQLSNKKVG